MIPCRIADAKKMKFSHYAKYLAFDCDDSPNIQSVIMKAKDYELLISNYLFETWLLMHFEDVKEKISKKKFIDVYLLIYIVIIPEANKEKHVKSFKTVILSKLLIMLEFWKNNIKLKVKVYLRLLKI